jgi:hypothetical protein
VEFNVFLVKGVPDQGPEQRESKKTTLSAETYVYGQRLPTLEVNISDVLEGEGKLG